MQTAATLQKPEDPSRPGPESNAEWKLWGRDDPLWSAASWLNKQRDGESPWTEEEFYALGESDWRDFLQQWRQYGLSTQSCLEIGCGPGRITRHLASCFDSVCAVDVSQDMIDYARKRVQAQNTTFAVVEGLKLRQPDRSVTAIFSAHVMQHLDSVEDGLAYFREFYRVLGEGGTVLVHLPLYQFPAEHRAIGRAFNATWTMWRRLGRLRALVKRHFSLKTMRDTPYPLAPLYAFLADLGFRKIEFRIFPVSSNGDLHPFVLATK